MRDNFVFDTNTLISAALSPFSKNAEAIIKAEGLGIIVYSEFTWQEFQHVLFRPKFDKYISVSTREIIAERFLNRFKKVTIDTVIRECRDPKDDIFLELAISCHAACIITGDSDLLSLHPFRNIPIFNASVFLEKF
ncbi:putative toxin-antitoxin system toxin component, PIN family [Dyadobacter sp. CY345]|uniref:putative toxin-antitoxin system toxin component, PIN family n=1 Tax=Dyadobacter sp. CY345 TaxID=2909335 RepID=UPI001F1AB384|nr:putative toxin-antitoxin system toxin component, PIN family [Dyadobacter sp. CY345]MCF2442689.1 putative toxin-antitoxin system toxin component, PIN family [Dyadobacter sp. CY345]